ncbi:MAG: FkbM family methyltransferase [Colwellia sp.]|nr:FkbM family methyltransferase [Colwellia sp.]
MRKLPRLVNYFARLAQIYDVPGKYRFYEATKYKFNRHLITYNIKGSEFSIPWDQWCFWKNYGPENYYLEEILPFTQTLNDQLDSFDFIDLGADVGVVSALVNKYCIALNNIIALEPNPTVFDVLQQNLLNISVNHLAFKNAISNFDGYGEFSFKSEQGSDHEGHLVNNTSGKTKVTTLDSLIDNNNIILAKNLAIKIDVEGQEKAMFTGAKETLKKADKVIILLELHPEVLTRDKQTAEDLFNEAEKIRSFKWLVPIQDNKLVDRSLNFYDQFIVQQYDVIGIAD